MPRRDGVGGSGRALDGRKRQPMVNRAVIRLVRSPISGLADKSLVLLTLRGKRTGDEITLPVQYAVGDNAIWLWPGRAHTKTWWRNLITTSPVRLRLLGTDVDGRATVVTAGSASADCGRSAFRERFPRTARAGLRSGSELPDPLVRVQVEPDVLTRARQATIVAGRGLPAMIRLHPLAAFFLLTYALSWGYWIPLAVTGGHRSHFPGLLGPMMAAFVVTAVATGADGTRDLLRRMARWRVPLRWYAAALIPLAAAAVALGAVTVARRHLPSWGELSTMPGLPHIGWVAVFLLTVLVNGYGEETGWRGFAWPQLRQRHGVWGSALLLTIPWAIWHIPTFWLDTGLRGFPLLLVPAFFISMTAGAVVLGWLYERARSSIFVVALFHASINMASATVGTAAVAPAASIAVVALAVLILRADTRATSRALDTTAP